MRSHTARSSFTTRIAYPLLARLIVLLIGVILLGWVLVTRLPENTWTTDVYHGVYYGLIILVAIPTVTFAAMTLIQNTRVRRERRKGPIMTIRNKPDETLLVPIVRLEGDEYDEAVDASEGTLMTLESVQAVIAHMSQWDYGDETDGAGVVNGLNSLGELKALPHDLDEHHHAGTDYLLLSDAGLRFCALYRELPDDEEVDHG